VVYLDDILIFSKSEKEHHQHLEEVVERLERVGLYANTRKCYFHKTEIDFLSFIIDRNGLRMDPSQVEAISEWHNYPPKMYHNIQVFLGFCNFYRRDTKAEVIYRGIAVPQGE
jgi:hypothetical protein